MLRPQVRTGEILSVLVPATRSTSPATALLAGSALDPTITPIVNPVRRAATRTVGRAVSAAGAAVSRAGQSVAQSRAGTGQAMSRIAGTFTSSGQQRGPATWIGTTTVAPASLDASGPQPGTVDAAEDDRGTVAISPAPVTTSTDPSGSRGGTTSSGGGGGRGERSASSGTLLPAGNSNPGGAYGRTLQDCMSVWDAKTHMTKEQWRTACSRTITR